MVFGFCKSKPKFELRFVLNKIKTKPIGSIKLIFLFDFFDFVCPSLDVYLYFTHNFFKYNFKKEKRKKKETDIYMCVFLDTVSSVF